MLLELPPIPGSHIVFYAERGQVHVRSTIYGSNAGNRYPIVSNLSIDKNTGEFNNVSCRHRC